MSIHTAMNDIAGPIRAARYRQFAAETLKLARTTEGADLKATYLSLAACWKRLSERAEGFEDEVGSP